MDILLMITKHIILFLLTLPFTAICMITQHDKRINKLYKLGKINFAKKLHNLCERKGATDSLNHDGQNKIIPTLFAMPNQNDVDEKTLELLKKIAAQHQEHFNMFETISKKETTAIQTLHMEIHLLAAMAQSYAIFGFNAWPPLAACGVNSVLNYISTYVHEHGHGLAGGDPNYKVTMIPVYRGLGWSGLCESRIPRETTAYNHFKHIIAGPLAGIFTIYMQAIGINFIDGTLNQKNWKDSLIFNPFSIITSIVFPNLQPETSFAKMIISGVKLATWFRLVNDVRDGLFPNTDNNRDGSRLWNIVLGKRCPAIISYASESIRYLAIVAPAILSIIRK